MTTSISIKYFDNHNTATSKQGTNQCDLLEQTGQLHFSFYSSIQTNPDARKNEGFTVKMAE